MDALIKTALSDNHSTVEDVVPFCYKILNWLAMKFREPLVYHNVEIVIKAATFVDECFAVFGETLSKALLEQYAYQKPMLENILEMNREGGCLAHVCTSILNSPMGSRHALAVERLLQQVQDKRQVTLTRNIYTNRYSTEAMPANRNKMQQLVQNIFQLPANQIECALKRMLDCLSFAVLGYVFLEPATSAYHDKCAIVAQKICDSIVAATAGDHFFWSMHSVAANSKKGIKLYWKCLEHQTFAESLMQFFAVYLHELCEKNVDVLMNAVYNDYVISNILFLVYCTLAVRSPCRLKFYAKLGSCKVSEDLFKNIINRIVCIYD